MDIKLMPEQYKKKGIGGGSVASKGSSLKFLGRLAEASFWFPVSSVLLILAILTSLGLWGYKISLNKESEGLAQKLEELGNQRDFDLENSFMELKGKIEGFKSILDKKTYASNILNILEELTLPRVQYIDFKADIIESSVVLELAADNYDSLVKQITIFEEDSRISEVSFPEAFLKKSGQIGSTINLKFDPSFLSSKENNE